jgi:hypothetical protein
MSIYHKKQAQQAQQVQQVQAQAQQAQPSAKTDGAAIPSSVLMRYSTHVLDSSS